MAERYAVATGNWSAVGTWDGGTTLPGSGDDVYSNNFTVTVDQNVTVLSLNNGPGTTAVAGGSFNIASASRTINANVNGYGNTNGCVNFTTGGSALTINGNLTGGSQANGKALRINVAQTVTLVGNVTGGSATGATGIQFNLTGATLNMTGHVVGGASGSGGHGITTSVACTVNITGNVTAGATANGIDLNHASAVVVVTGKAIGNNWPTTGSKFFAINVATALSGGSVKVDGIECGGTGAWPISGNVFVNNLATATALVYNSALTSATLDAQTPYMSLVGGSGLVG